MHSREELIRKRAHQIWEEQGQPAGREDEHWQQAAEEIDSLSAAGARDMKRKDPTPEEEGAKLALTTTREAGALAAAASAPKE